MRDRTNIRDALENHEENKNKDLSSTICEFVSLECTPQVRYRWKVYVSKDIMKVLNVDADGHTVDSLRRRTYTIEKGRARVALLLVILREKNNSSPSCGGKYWNILL